MVPIRGDAFEFDVEFPDNPDIPSLIKAWHAEPSTANRLAVWKAIREHGVTKHNYFHAYYRLGESTYFAAKTEGDIVVGSLDPSTKPYG